MGSRESRKEKEQVKGKVDMPQVKRTANVTDSKLAMIIMSVGVTGSLLFFAIFMFSGVKDNIVAAKQPTIYAYVDSDSVTDEGSDDDSADDKDKVDDGSTSDSIINVEIDNITIDQDELVQFLEGLSDAEFEEFLKGVLMQSDSEEMVELRKRIIGQALEQAYKDAELLFPGQIDSSMRLKLVAELNAVDFMYYVVEQGDTLGELSAVFNVPIGQLLEINGIQNADLIRIGEILLVPSDERINTDEGLESKIIQK